MYVLQQIKRIFKKDFSKKFNSKYYLFSHLCLFRIDCVGILKLRNADIELRNGETDIGRKNTRVRLVFRVHIPEPGGHLVSLQAASNPIECCKKYIFALLRHGYY